MVKGSTDIHGIRVTPDVVVIDHFETGKTYTVQLNLLNISSHKKESRWYAPQSKLFKLVGACLEDTIACGMSLPCVLEFTPKELKQLNDRLVVTVDGTVVQIPVKCLPSRATLELDPVVDFGTLCANNKLAIAQLAIVNKGSRTGQFEFRCANSPVNFSPQSGKLPAGARHVIRVEFVAKKIGRIAETISLTCEGAASQDIQVFANVVEGRLELLSPSEMGMACVQFGHVYFGTDRSVFGVLYNNSPDPIDFVCVMEENAKGLESGTDISADTGSVLRKADNRYDGTAVNIMDIVSTIPNQGHLNPFQKMPILFRFSPRWNMSSQGFQVMSTSPPRQDYALFLAIKPIGATGVGKSEGTTGVLEVPMTGTALSVQLDVGVREHNFGRCAVGERREVAVAVRNRSPHLAAIFNFPKTAHFQIKPEKGVLRPDAATELLIAFTPRQFGDFSVTQLCEILGDIADSQDPFMIKQGVIYHENFSFIGKCQAITTQPSMKFNQGITPKLSNEVGLNVEATFASDECHCPPQAMLMAHSHKNHLKDKVQFRAGDLGSGEKIAYPNDRNASIRPFNRRDKYRTIFTRVSRYNYVDPDYSYDNRELCEVEAHKTYYQRYLRELQELRQLSKRDKAGRKFENATNIGLPPGSGLRPPKLLVSDIRDDVIPVRPNAKFAPLSSKKLQKLASQTSSKSKIEGMNAEPLTVQEKNDCKKFLTPQQLHCVLVGPPTIDFEEVCLHSQVVKTITVVNNLEQHIHIKAKIDCAELRQSSPIQMVVPPASNAEIPIYFEAQTLGRFQRSLEYVINGTHKNHVTVLAHVCPVELILSTTSLSLVPTPGLSPEAGLRGTVTLRNNRNRAAEFQWKPILSDGVIAFSIRPAVGIVEPFQELDCEVVFHASYYAPSEGQFICQVRDGNQVPFVCIAKLGQTNVQLLEKRIMFGSVPINLPTMKKCPIYNAGPNHAYFCVDCPYPFADLSISPTYGVIPVGGTAQLDITIEPSGQLKFDTKTLILIRGAKPLDLRMGGTADPPTVDIDVPSFKYGGVPVGSSSVQPFRLQNRTSSNTQVIFDLFRYRDFTLSFPNRVTPEETSFNLDNIGKFMVMLSDKEVVNCELTFTPTEIASYDFVMPVTINANVAPTPKPTPLPGTPAPSSSRQSVEHIVVPRPQPVNIATPRRHVVATALRQPLQLSSLEIKFDMPVPTTESLRAFGAVEERQQFVMRNNTSDPQHWNFDLSAVPDDGTFRFLRGDGTPFLSRGTGGLEGDVAPGKQEEILVSFVPTKPGNWEISIPIILNCEYKRPYQYLALRGHLKAPHMSFEPCAVVLPAVPLRTPTSFTFDVIATDYRTACQLRYELPDVESEDGSKTRPLSVTFPAGDEIRACAESRYVLPVTVTFAAERPVAFQADLKFFDHHGQEFSLPVSAAADNCLLTNYGFLASSQHSHQIVCEQGMRLKGTKTASHETLSMGEAVLVPIAGAEPSVRAQSARPGTGPSRPSTSVTSSSFDVSMSSYEASTTPDSEESNEDVSPTES